MEFRIHSSPLRGEVRIPGSKSHTIRAVAVAALAEGESVIGRPLVSADALAARDAYRLLGAEITDEGDRWRVRGLGGRPRVPENVIDVRNSGTTMRIALGTAALLDGPGAVVLTGDAQVRRRPCGPLAQTLTALGASVRSTRGTGMPPFVVEGTLSGGEAELEAVTSQYVSSLLFCCPLAPDDTRLRVTLLNEKPYVEMTLDWLARQGVTVHADPSLMEYHIPGGQAFQPVNRDIPGDFSSATFFLAAGALPDNEVFCRGLDMTDTQGDKAVVEYLRAMGARVSVEGDGVRVSADALRGVEIDMNATPDALPMMAVMGCFAAGETRLVNVPQARLKETDRIAVMHRELEKMGARVTELPDGLVISESPLRGAAVESHDDHRIAMALAVAGTRAAGETIIKVAEAVEVTYPEFPDHLAALGGRLEKTEENGGI